MLDCPASGQPGTGIKKNANGWTSPILECFDQPEMILDAGLPMSLVLASMLKPSFACWSFYTFLSSLSPLSPSLTFPNFSVFSTAFN